MQSFVREVEQAGTSEAEETPHTVTSPETEADQNAPELPRHSPSQHPAEPDGGQLEGQLPHSDGSAPREHAEVQVHSDWNLACR